MSLIFKENIFREANYHLVYDYRLVYKIFSEQKKIQLPFCLIDSIYIYLFSPREHFKKHIAFELWKQAWIYFKEKQIEELQVLLTFLFDIWGITNNHYNIDNIYKPDWHIQYYFPDSVTFTIDNCLRFDKEVVHVTVFYENYPANYYYIMDQEAYKAFCYYDGCERFYWMTDVYETEQYHLLQATMRF